METTVYYFSENKQRQKEATLTGIFFITAAISSIIGLKLYDPVLNTTEGLVPGGASATQVVAGALCELILALSAMGTALTLLPHLRRYHESMGAAYLVFRGLEVVFILIGMLGVLTTLSISQEYHATGMPTLEQARAVSRPFIALHRWCFMLGPNFMLAVNTFLYSWVFFKTGIVPAWLSRMGLAAAGLIFLAALLEMFGIIEQLSLWGILLALPIAAYEMTLAVWLLRR